MEKWQNPETIAIWIVIAVVFFLVILIFITVLLRAFLKKLVKAKLAESKAETIHQQRLLDTTIKTQEIERVRIAEDLHDALIGKLMVIKLQQEVHDGASLETLALIKESIRIARRISHDLSPPLLEFTTLSDLLLEVLDPWKERFTLLTKLDIRSKDNVDNNFKIQCIRILQELVTNIEKHGKASKVEFHFRQSNNSISIELKDNGVGFCSKNNQKGLGLKNIETRVQYLKGKYRISSVRGEGTRVLIYFNKLNKKQHA